MTQIYGKIIILDRKSMPDIHRLIDNEHNNAVRLSVKPDSEFDQSVVEFIQDEHLVGCISDPDLAVRVEEILGITDLQGTEVPAFQPGDVLLLVTGRQKGVDFLSVEVEPRLAIRCYTCMKIIRIVTPEELKEIAEEDLFACPECDLGPDDMPF